MNEKEIQKVFCLCFFDCAIMVYKKKCVDAAIFAKINRDNLLVYNTMVTFAKDHLVKLRFYKELKRKFESEV